MAGYQIYEKVGGQLVPISLTTEERLSQVEQSCLDYHNNGLKKANLATAAETTAGTAVDKVVTPAGLKVELDKKVTQSELETALKELIVEFGGTVPQ